MNHWHDEEGPGEFDAHLTDEGEDEVACPSCGRSVWAQAQKCPHCGEWFIGGAAEDLVAGRPGLRGLWWWVAAVLLAAILILVALFGRWV